MFSYKNSIFPSWSPHPLFTCTSSGYATIIPDLGHLCVELFLSWSLDFSLGIALTLLHVPSSLSYRSREQNHV